MKKQFLLGTSLLASALLVGCGGGSGNSGTSISQYSISDYTAVDTSSSLVGTWVMVANGSEKDIYSDYWEEADFSKRSILTIKEDNGLKISNCSSGFSSLSFNQSGAVYMPDTSGEAVQIVDNKTMSGEVSETDSDGGYEKYTYDYIKISNTVASLGTVDSNWSGSATSINTEDELIAFCARSFSKLDSDGDRSVFNEYELGVEQYDRDTELTKGTWFGESVEKVTASGSEDTLSETPYWGGVASVDYTETKSSFIGSFSATSNSGVSVSGTVNAQFPVQ